MCVLRRRTGRSDVAEAIRSRAAPRSTRARPRGAGVRPAIRQRAWPGWCRASVADVQVASVPNGSPENGRGDRRRAIYAGVIAARRRAGRAGTVGTLAFGRGQALLIQLREIMESTDR